MTAINIVPAILGCIGALIVISIGEYIDRKYYRYSMPNSMMTVFLVSSILSITLGTGATVFQTYLDYKGIR